MMSSYNPRAYALVPARAGSKSVVNKNFRLISQGDSLASLAVKCAFDSGIFTDVILSSDSPEAVEIANISGCRLHHRPEWASSDEATSSDVLKSVLSYFQDLGVTPDDFVFYLQPTSPTRTSRILFESWSRILNEKPEGLVTVAKSSVGPFKHLEVSVEGLLRSLHGDQIATANRQALPTTYLATGDFFAFKWGSFLDKGVFPLSNCLPVFRDSYLDIDTENDFATAINGEKQS